MTRMTVEVVAMVGSYRGSAYDDGGCGASGIGVIVAWLPALRGGGSGGGDGGGGDRGGWWWESL